MSITKPKENRLSREKNVEGMIKSVYDEIIFKPIFLP